MKKFLNSDLIINSVKDGDVIILLKNKDNQSEITLNKIIKKDLYIFKKQLQKTALLHSNSDIETTTELIEINDKYINIGDYS